MAKLKYIGTIFGLLLTLSACDQAPQKTDSMLRLENAHKQAQLLVNQANGLLKPEVIQEPAQHLDTLVYASEITKDALKVYKNLNILSWDNAELELLQQRLSSMHPALAKQAIVLIKQLVERTAELRIRIEEIKNRPYGSQSTSTVNMVEYLSKEYNTDIQACCLVDLGRISKLLSENRTQYRSFIEIINNITRELEAVIKDPKAADRLLLRLQKLDVG